MVLSWTILICCWCTTYASSFFTAPALLLLFCLVVQGEAGEIVFIFGRANAKWALTCLSAAGSEAGSRNVIYRRIVYRLYNRLGIKIL